MPTMKSLLSVAGWEPQAFSAAFSAGAGAVILDLEGRAGPSGAIAEKALAEALRLAGGCRVYIKVRGSEVLALRDRIELVAGAPLDGIILAKAESRDRIHDIDVLLSELEGTAGLGAGTLDLMPLIETPRGIAEAGAICAALGRIKRVAFGAGDYCRALNLARTFEERELGAARAALVSASRAQYREPPIDTPFPYARELEQFRRIAERSRDMGFQGKICIHADQVRVANEVFARDGAG